MSHRTIIFCLSALLLLTVVVLVISEDKLENKLIACEDRMAASKAVAERTIMERWASLPTPMVVCSMVSRLERPQDAPGASVAVLMERYPGHGAWLACWPVLAGVEGNP